jgi:hypothetical protein
VGAPDAASNMLNKLTVNGWCALLISSPHSTGTHTNFTGSILTGARHGVMCRRCWAWLWRQKTLCGMRKAAQVHLLLQLPVLLPTFVSLPFTSCLMKSRPLCHRKGM